MDRRPALVVALLGAESTGKTMLARALAERLAQETGQNATWVPEALRDWCEAAGRTPRADEQLGIAQAQHARLERAAEANAFVVCDTTALMTAVYSRIVFGDRSLEAWAVQAHTRVSLTLVTALDLPWVADGLQRDGPHMQAPVDEALQELLRTHALPWVRVAGHGPARLQAAWDAVQPLLRLS
jgi:nicotinamide riboside kinase